MLKPKLEISEDDSREVKDVIEAINYLLDQQGGGKWAMGSIEGHRTGRGTIMIEVSLTDTMTLGVIGVQLVAKGYQFTVQDNILVLFV